MLSLWPMISWLHLSVVSIEGLMRAFYSRKSPVYALPATQGTCGRDKRAEARDWAEVQTFQEVPGRMTGA